MTQQSELLKGWRQIAGFLGQPLSVVERWAKEGLPVNHQGRSVVASPDELNRWLQRESGEPVHIATETGELTADLKRSVSRARH
jgi:hypothetical protein